jgi:hypothetical protein
VFFPYRISCNSAYISSIFIVLGIAILTFCPTLGKF